MSLYQNVQRHTGLTQPFQFFDIRTPNVKKIKKGGLDQYGAKHFEV